MQMIRSLAIAFLAVPLWLALPAAALAEDPVGTVKIETTKISVGLGWEWGGGTLTLKDGSTHEFKIQGLNVIGVGAVGLTATGQVFNLTNIADFAGDYASVEASAALVVGAGWINMKNEKGVLLALKSEQGGVNLQLGPRGMGVSMKE